MAFSWEKRPIYNTVSEDWFGECLIGETVAEIHLFKPPEECEQEVSQFLTWLNKDLKKILTKVAEMLIDEDYYGEDELTSKQLASELEIDHINFIHGTGAECNILGGEDYFNDMSLAAVIGLDKKVTNAYIY